MAVSSVGQLSSEAVIDVLGHLTAGIDGTPPPPESLSRGGLHLAERHQACMLVASQVRNTGYGEPLSAHELLYPAEAVIRKLLLALVSMLPPEGAMLSPPSPSHAAEARIPSGTSPEEAEDFLTPNVVIPRDANSEEEQGWEDEPPAHASAHGANSPGDDGAGSEETTAAMEPPPEEAGELPAPEGSSVEEASAFGGNGGDIERTPERRAAEDEEGGGSSSSSSSDFDESKRETADPRDENAGDSGTEADGQNGGASERGGSEASGVDVTEGRDLERSHPEAEAAATSAAEGAVSDGPSGGSVGESDRALEEESESGPANRDGHAGRREDVDDEEEDRAGMFEKGGSAEQVTDDLPSEYPSVGSDLGHGDAATDDDGDRGFRGARAASESGDEANSTSSGGRADIDGDHLVARTEQADCEAGGIGHEGHDGVEPGDAEGERLSATAGDTGQRPATEKPSAVGDVPPDGVADDDPTPSAGERGGKTVQNGGGARKVDETFTADEEAAPSSGTVVSPLREKQQQQQHRDEDDGDRAAPREQTEDPDAVSSSSVEEGGEGGDDDVVFLQFEVEAQETELDRLLREEDVASKVAGQLEEEVRRMGSLAEEREAHCRHTAKALELLPHAANEAGRLQREIAAAEARVQAARKAFASSSKPLEEAVRSQREELARRKARCRELLEEMRTIYASCEEMSRQASALSAKAREMEAWERRGRPVGKMLILADADDGDDSGREEEWGLDEEEDEEELRARRAGALLRADMDARILALCEEATAQKQEIAISLSEVRDARREANAAWELLGRAEALAEERLFAVTREAALVGGNKERSRDLIEAYRRLHGLEGVFLKLVEAVAALGRSEEEYRSVVDETDQLVAQYGGPTRAQLLARDLKRVRGDAFALEQRLDETLEEQRLKQEQRAQQEQQQQEPAREAEEKVTSMRSSERHSVDLENEGVEEAGRDARDVDCDDGEHQWQAEEGSDSGGATQGPVDAKHSTDTREPDAFSDVGSVAAAERDGVSESGGGQSEYYEHAYDGEGDVDFVGDDEEDNVWQ